MSLCILADAGALLSQGKVALVSPLPIARQLLSWPYSYFNGSLSCSALLKRRRLRRGSSRTSLPQNAPPSSRRPGSLKGCSSVRHLSPTYIQAIAALDAPADNGFLRGGALMKTENPQRWSTLSTCHFPFGSAQVHPGFP